jgi:hypothetical protein
MTPPSALQITREDGNSRRLIIEVQDEGAIDRMTCRRCGHRTILLIRTVVARSLLGYAFSMQGHLMRSQILVYPGIFSNSLSLRRNFDG